MQEVTGSSPVSPTNSPVSKSRDIQGVTRPEREWASVDHTRDVIDDLATVLFALVTGKRGTGAVTAQITHEIGRWAVGRGWLPHPEARVLLADQPDHRPRVGYLDMVVLRHGDGPDLAIEIDSTDKQWSLAKLRYVVAAGMHGIWIRWGDDAWAGIYDEVDVIQLPEVRRAAPRLTGRGQLSLWAK